jgi:hypothetical protein
MVLLQPAAIVRRAGTDHFDIPQSARLWAVSADLSHNDNNRHQMLEIGMKMYDALYSRAKNVQQEKHTWNPDILK